MKDLKKVIRAFNERLRVARKMYGEDSEIVKSMTKLAKKTLDFDWTDRGYISASVASLEKVYAKAYAQAEKNIASHAGWSEERKKEEKDKAKNMINARIKRAVKEKSAAKLVESRIKAMPKEKQTEYKKLKGQERIDYINAREDYIKKMDEMYEKIFSEMYEDFSLEDLSTISHWLHDNHAEAENLYDMWMEGQLTSEELGAEILERAGFGTESFDDGTEQNFDDI